MEIVNQTRYFDLNIEEILDNWKIHHGIREIISNALDEQLLSETDDIQIDKVDENEYHIRDFGRGLHYSHLTMNENEEKMNNDFVIGKFGIGLKDALATFYRSNISCTIKSKYNDIVVYTRGKHGFDNIETLHAEVSPPSINDIVGTLVILNGVSDEDIENAKKLFLQYSQDVILEHTPYGQILLKGSEFSNIYINGMKVSSE